MVDGFLSSPVNGTNGASLIDGYFSFGFPPPKTADGAGDLDLDFFIHPAVAYLAIEASLHNEVIFLR